ncbi:ribonuclease BN/unknown domain fusion protein [Poriferisphaera corsica]|uniref:Uncharacterized protein n=1 Tax=Poriferisphaera corsica TaxID=2528020 RepID=A0A517YWJ0_9BACT|nr:YihY/virulence factor BrkB family protein [Poriferisphaera corsica]QDU34593.1 ribonuclease BN/unknown domain fusion protein [Poriferisphaera corsica]
MPNLTNILTAIKRILSTPVDELSRAQLHLRNTIDLVFFCGRKMKEDRATQMAAALTYRTIFSLVPLTVLALLIFKAFGGFAALGDNTQEGIYNYLGIDFATQTHTPPDKTAASQDVNQTQHLDTAPSPPSNQPLHTSSTNAPPPLTTTTTTTTTTTQTAPSNQTQQTVVTFFENLDDQVSDINLAGFGAIGIAVLIWGAVSLLVTAERSFNTIYQCPAGRSWHMRITIYWAIITLGPVLLFISFFAATQALDFANSIPGLSTLFSLLSTFTALITTWLLLLILYMLMPNTRVAFRPALIGSLVAATLWELGKSGFRLYVTKALSAASLNVALYGSLGLILIFLLWIYITWLIIVFGLEITSTLQLLPGQRLKNHQQQSDANAVLSTEHLLLFLAATAHNFCHAEPTTAQSLAQSLSLSARSIQQLADFLITHHLIHRLDTSDTSVRAFSLAKPPQDIPLSHIIDLAHEQTTSRLKDTPDFPTSRYLNKLIKAQKSATHSQTLADIIAHK